jgi:hypothetical protein
VGLYLHFAYFFYDVINFDNLLFDVFFYCIDRSLKMIISTADNSSLCCLNEPVLLWLLTQPLALLLATEAAVSLRHHFWMRLGGPTNH